MSDSAELQRSHFDGVLYDITKPNGPVSIDYKKDGSVLWVNIGSTCVLRICQNTQGLDIPTPPSEGEDESADADVSAPHTHEWVSVENEKVKGGEMCRHCGIIRSTPNLELPPGYMRIGDYIESLPEADKVLIEKARGKLRKALDLLGVQGIRLALNDEDERQLRSWADRKALDVIDALRAGNTAVLARAEIADATAARFRRVIVEASRALHMAKGFVQGTKGASTESPTLQVLLNAITTIDATLKLYRAGTPATKKAEFDAAKKDLFTSYVATLVYLRKALRLIPHGPFNHDLIQDEKACPTCQFLSKANAILYWDQSEQKEQG